MSSNERIVQTLFKLLTGEKLELLNEAKINQVNIRTIQRDFSIIKNISSSFGYKLTYEEMNKKYFLENPNRLEFKDSLAIVKILLASRAFTTLEIKSLLHTIIYLNTDDDINSIEKFIQNELTFYHPLKHNKTLLPNIQMMSTNIENKKIISIEYKKNTGLKINREVLPVSIFFSEYYFYIICYEINKERYINLRADRFTSIMETNKSFTIPYKDRLEEKELREKMIFMQYGEKKRFKFKFSGIVEAALDKFPNSKVIQTLKDGSVLIEAEAYDKGVIMWILSQGSLAQIISPPSLVRDIKFEIQKMHSLYN